MYQIKNLSLFILLSIMSLIVEGQEYAYEVKVEPYEIDNLGGLQSFAHANYGDEWLLVGGRLDGLHRRQPWASFDAQGMNNELIVVNPQSNTVWKAPLESLPSNMKEQLSSTNMEFYQRDSLLICIGGYGFSPTANDHITFPYLTVINIPQTIQAIKAGNLSPSTFQQIEDTYFRVTGGGFNVLDEVYHLVGGQSFMGRYNPMGPNMGPGFIQEYTNEVRRFELAISQDTVTYTQLATDHDERHLHKRDYNLAPYIKDGNRHLMAYSGVFQPAADIPWLYPVSIDKNGYEAIEDFQQFFNHYHSAVLPIYDSEVDEMHTLFFGGIAQYYQEAGILVQDNDVPFVNTIADVLVTADDALMEVKLEQEMPGLLGAGSAFIPNSNVVFYDDEILDGSAIGNEFMEVGYIYGGIRSSLPNIFWINTGTESEASKTLYKVAVRKIEVTSTNEQDIKEKNFIEFYPNPTSQVVRMRLDLDKSQDVNVFISDSTGRMIHQQEIPSSQLDVGVNHIVIDGINIGYGSYLYTVQIGNTTLTRKVIWTE